MTDETVMRVPLGTSCPVQGFAQSSASRAVAFKRQSSSVGLDIGVNAFIVHPNYVVGEQWQFLVHCFCWVRSLAFIFFLVLRVVPPAHPSEVFASVYS